MFPRRWNHKCPATMIMLPVGQRLPAQWAHLWMVCSPGRTGAVDGRRRIPPRNSIKVASPHPQPKARNLQPQLFLQVMRRVSAGFQLDAIGQQHRFAARGQRAQAEHGLGSQHDVPLDAQESHARKRGLHIA